MPLWIYHLHPVLIALGMQLVVVSAALLGLWLSRRYLLPKVRMHDGVNDAISGTVQSIGVFYGVTVGLIAVGVWNTATAAQDVVSQEASSLAALYRDVRSFPNPAGRSLGTHLRHYIEQIVQADWPDQRAGKAPTRSTPWLDKFQKELVSFEPHGPREEALFSEALAAYNRMITQRRLRLDAVEAGLSEIMWVVIWAGAVISIGVGYLFHLEDQRLHMLLVGLTAAYLALVLFMIVLNDKPFYGTIGVSVHSYELILDTIASQGR